MTPKEKLIALAVTFGIIAEGLTAPQLQEALDANAGYQAFVAKENEVAQAISAKDTAEAKVAELEAELDQANETISNMAAEAAEVLTADPNKILFTDEDGDTYEITQPTFRYRGREYKSAEAVDAHRDVLQELVEAKAFIFKRQ